MISASCKAWDTSSQKRMCEGKRREKWVKMKMFSHWAHNISHWAHNRQGYGLQNQGAAIKEGQMKELRVCFCFLLKNDDSLAGMMRVDVAKQCKKGSGFSSPWASCVSWLPDRLTWSWAAILQGRRKWSFHFLCTPGVTRSLLSMWNAPCLPGAFPFIFPKPAQGHPFHDTFPSSMLTRLF